MESLVQGQALVRKVENGAIVVEAMPRTACGGCAHLRGCGISTVAGLLERGKGARLTLPVGAGEYQPGDTVVLGVASSVLLRAALLTYVLPVAALVVGALAVAVAGGGDGAALIGGGVGLATGLGGARIAARRQERVLRPVLLGRAAGVSECETG